MFANIQLEQKLMGSDGVIVAKLQLIIKPRLNWSLIFRVAALIKLGVSNEFNNLRIMIDIG